MASVAEVKAAINTAMEHVLEGQEVVAAAGEKLTEAQGALAVALDGSGHDAVLACHAALAQAALELDECLAATAAAVEQAEQYVATL
ncbi:hypothetical protein Lfu02_52530 [Longispora fulva]|uniref:Uncharacterized protein n=1 Tax=Longispora fulva TaxID=619741 RepID=A0A8J7KMT0_9ACTN|nr:hypothetical protein [Longispora fulva]MBG6140854.1 hypothetical protein [Longispora fulva]GIG60881.1 hypothetical protein Lfu02_52530 [Longispora fulva]